MKQTRLLFIDAGHSNVLGRDQGASGLTETEGVIVARIRHKLVTKLRENKIKVYTDSDNSVTKETVAYLKSLRLPANSLALSIHCNAFVNPKARGTEAVIPETPTKFEQAAAAAYITAINKATGIPIRRVITEGQSARKKLLWMSVPVETVLIELGFITNKDDNRLLDKFENELVDALYQTTVSLICE